MSVALDVIERLLTAAQHPDIVRVARYGPASGPWGPNVQQSKVKAITGVKVTHQSTSTASLWEAVWPGETPVDLPAVMPPTTRRGVRLLILVHQVLDAARPAEVRAWRQVALPGLGPDDADVVTPDGISLAMADGTRVLLRASSTGATVGDEPKVEPFPDYVIPAALTA